MVWQPIFTDDYEESLDRLRLETEEIFRLAEVVVARATTYPENVPPLDGLKMRVAEEHGADGITAVRVYYWIEGNVVYLAHIEQYEDCEDEEEEAE